MGYRRAQFPTAGARVAFGGVGADYANIVTLSGVEFLVITSSLNVECILSFNAGVTNHLFVPPGLSLVIPVGTAEIQYNGTVSVIQGAAGGPASGMISILGINGQ